MAVLMSDVLMPGAVQVRAFRDVSPCSLAGVYGSFVGLTLQFDV
jgi:hypothetical protein